MADFVGAVDQGTTSTRFMIFDHGGNEIARHQLEHEQILPEPGWVEHNPTEIWERTRAVIETALREANLKFSRRFRAMEQLVRQRNLDMQKLSGDELQTIWKEVKGAEKLEIRE